MNISRGLIRNFSSTINKDFRNFVRDFGKQRDIVRPDKVYKPGADGYDTLMRAVLKFESDPKNISLVGSHAAKAKRPEK